MSRRVRIAELKAKLSEHLRYVRRGGSVIVLDRETPIAKVIPHGRTAERLDIRPPLTPRPIGDLPLPPPLKTEIDIVELLLEDRYSGR